MGGVGPIDGDRVRRLLHDAPIGLVVVAEVDRALLMPRAAQAELVVLWEEVVPESRRAAALVTPLAGPRAVIGLHVHVRVDHVHVYVHVSHDDQEPLLQLVFLTCNANGNVSVVRTRGLSQADSCRTAMAEQKAMPPVAPHLLQYTRARLLCCAVRVCWGTVKRRRYRYGCTYLPGGRWAIATEDGAGWRRDGEGHPNWE